MFGFLAATMAAGAAGRAAGQAAAESSDDSQPKSLFPEIPKGSEQSYITLAIIIGSVVGGFAAIWIIGWIIYKIYEYFKKPN